MVTLPSGAAAEEIDAPLTTIICALIGIAGTLGVAPWVLRNQRHGRGEYHGD